MISLLTMKQDERLPVPSPRIEMLFHEYLRRYMELRSAQKQELIWLLVSLLLGILSLLIPLTSTMLWTLPALVVLLVLTVYAIWKYTKSNQKVEHLKINVAILEHHLTGAIEVGFCEHDGPCQCAERFRRYVRQHYQISI